MSEPLDGVVVLDLTRVLAGPLCTQTLAEMGARVWKIESPAGDDTRRWGPPFLDDDRSAYFASANRGKHSIAVDLKADAGRHVVAELAARADVVVENFRTGDLARYGLDAATLRHRHPDLIHVSITGYGHTGPRASEPGYDLVLQAVTGWMAATGEPDRPPVRVGAALIDVMTGMQATVAVLAALRERDATGSGTHVDLSLFDVGVTSLVNLAQSALTTGEPTARWGSAHPTIVPYQAFRTADGWIVIAVGNETQFARLCEVLGRHDLPDQPRYATNPDRVVNRRSLIATLDEAVVAWSTDELLRALGDAGVPAGPVNDVAEALRDPQAVARELVRSVGSGDDQQELLGSPLGATATAPPPHLGQHTRAVLTGVLRMSDAEVDTLAAAGAVVVHD